MNKSFQPGTSVVVDEEVRPLHDLCSLLETHGIRYIVHGGWAAEYYLQRTRPHRDIDLASPVSEWPNYLALFRTAEDLRNRSKIKFCFEGVTAEVTFTDTPRGDFIVVRFKNRSVRVPRRLTEPVLAPIRGRMCPILPCAMICLNALVCSGGRLDTGSKYDTDFKAMFETLTQAEREEIEQLARQPESLLDRLMRLVRR